MAVWPGPRLVPKVGRQGGDFSMGPDRLEPTMRSVAVRKMTSFGMTAMALGALGWVAAAQAQTAPAPEGTPAPTTSVPAAPAPAPTPAPAPEAAPAPADTAPAASTPAPDAGSTPAAAPMKTKHHHASHMAKSGKSHKAEAGDAAVEDLNAKSLSAAKSGTSFAPATTPTPAPAKTTGKGMSKSGKTMHHHHMSKKKSSDTTAAPEGTPAASSDTGK